MSTSLHKKQFSPTTSRYGPALQDTEATPKPFFAVDSNRGWLESHSIHESGSSLSEKSQETKLEKKTGEEAQKAKDMLGAVSNEDILKLTQMTSMLISPTPKPPVKENKPRISLEKPKHGERLTHGQEKRLSAEEPSLEQTWQMPSSTPKTAEHTPISSSYAPLLPSPSLPCRPLNLIAHQVSHSTPPPSVHAKDNKREEIKETEYSSSWYRSLMKKDKFKGKHREEEDDHSSCDDTPSHEKTGSDSRLQRRVKKAMSSERTRKLAPTTGLKGRLWPGHRYRRTSSVHSSDISHPTHTEAAQKDKRHSMEGCASLCTEFPPTSFSEPWTRKTEAMGLYEQESVSLESRQDTEDMSSSPEGDEACLSSDISLGRRGRRMGGDRVGSRETNAPVDTKTLLFDSATLSRPVVLLLKEYEKQGKCRWDQYRTSHKETVSEKEQDMELEERVLVGSLAATVDPTRDKHIVQIKATRMDPMGFLKLIQLSRETSVDSQANNDPLLVDLHVSMLAMEIEESEGEGEESMDCYQDSLALSETLSARMKELLDTLQNGQAFLNRQRSVIASLTLDDTDSCSSTTTTASRACLAQKHKNSISRKNSSLNQKTLSESQEGVASIHRAPSLLLNNIPYRRVNPFDYRLDDVKLSAYALEKELESFKMALEATEQSVNNVKMDVKNTKSHMELLINSIPESHFSALKKLEVDIESILSSRAKSPWLDTAYTLLSYLLTLFALCVWTIICVLRWGRRVVQFPQQAWVAYHNYKKGRSITKDDSFYLDAASDLSSLRD